MNRRDFLKTLTAGVVIMNQGNASTQASDRPNVLFISFDDLNHFVGFLDRQPNAITPNFNRLAERSMVFEHAYCQAPICNPSRASLMSGLRPSTTGVYGNRQPLRFSPVGEKVVTLPQHFRENGYLTTGSGKVYHGKFPDPMSWDSYTPGRFNQSHQEAKPPYEPLNGMQGMGNVDWGPLDVADEEMQDWKAVDYCIGQLNRAQEKPFFLTCGFKLPHLTWFAPRKYFDLYDLDEIVLPEVQEDDLEDVPEFFSRRTNARIHRRIVEEGKWQEGVRAYLACISFVDMLIGRLVDALDRSAFAENTTVVLWADHGWHLGEKLHWKKSTLWEEATHVPLLIAAPGYAPGRCQAPVGLIDIYPTLIDLCGLSERSGLEGTSLIDQLEDPEEERDVPAISTHMRGNHAVRFGHWRYIRYHDGSEELYDRARDPYEWKNLAGDLTFAEIKQQLARRLPGHDAPDSEIVEWPEGQEMYRERIEAMMSDL